MLRPKTVILTPVDVDPRSWFSNERTCIEWLHSAGILGAFASGLIASGDSAMRFAGMSLLIPALTVVVHAKRQHSERSKQLEYNLAVLKRRDADIGQIHPRPNPPARGQIYPRP